MTIVLQRMDFSISQPLNLDQSSYVTWIGGTITGINEDDEEIPIGYIQAIQIDCDEIEENGEDLFSVVDTTYSEICDFVSSVYDPEMLEYSERVHKLFNEEIASRNLLYILSARVIPEARGGNIGLAMILTAIERFGKYCGLVGILPAPQQFDISLDTEAYQQMRLDTFSADRVTAMRKLKAHYSKIGFKDLNGDDYMVLSPEFRLPSIYEICQNNLL